MKTYAHVNNGFVYAQVTSPREVPQKEGDSLVELEDRQKVHGSIYVSTEAKFYAPQKETVTDESGTYERLIKDETGRILKDETKPIDIGQAIKKVKLSSAEKTKLETKLSTLDQATKDRLVLITQDLSAKG
jgi:hypothetical protein